MMDREGLSATPYNRKIRTLDKRFAKRQSIDVLQIPSLDKDC